jgi:hypothetical protein
MRQTMKCTLSAVLVALALASCRGPEVDKPAVKSALAPAGETTLSQPATPATAPEGSPTALPQVVLAEAAPSVIYVCVAALAGQTRQTPIEFSPQVAELCSKAPEMGPCQYEREACRRNGGRVFAVDGTEITLQTEAEYDRRVMRVRMKSN